MSLEFGESHLDRIEVWRVGRQEEEPGAFSLQTLGSSGAFMDGEIVENNNVASRQGWGKLGFDPCVEAGPVDCLVDHPWRGQLAAAQASDEGLCSPMAERRIGGQPLAAKGTPAKPNHFGGDGGLVDKDEAVRLKPHPGLAAVCPEATRSPDVRACGLRRHQRFFYM